MFRFGDPGGRIYGAVGTSNANMLSLWSVVNTNGGTWSLPAGGGRTVGTCLRINNYTGNNQLGKNLDSQSVWGVAFAIKFNGTYAASVPIVGFWNGGAATSHVSLHMTGGGSLQFMRNSGSGLGTNIGSVSSISLSSNVWNHIEVKTTLHATAGIVECRVNGLPVIGPTGSLNTTNGSGTTASYISLGNFSNLNGGAITTDYDDIIIYDGQTTDAAGNPDIADFIGDCSLAWLLPTGAGSSTQYTPDSGSNYARVQDTTIDTTSYVESSTVNNIDSYAMADLPAGASLVKTAAVVSYARKTDTGNRGAKNLIRTASTNYPHTNEISLLDSYLYYFQNWGSNPNTAGAWAVSEVNSLEVGQKVSS